MQFHRVHIEVTNICGLSCIFCPPKLQPTQTMNLDFFDKVLGELQGKTKELAFHVMGDPLTLSNLKAYLQKSYEKNFEVTLTTSGYYLHKTSFDTLFHPAVRQVNISLNSFNKNSLNLTFDDYMKHVFDMCTFKLELHPKAFINLRLWNLDKQGSEDRFNKDIFERLSKHFNITFDLEQINKEQPKNIRLDSKVLLHFDSYFEWPALASHHNSQGTCYGLQSHIGILADGRVVPCCLDGEGVINLGNLHDKSLNTILDSKRAVDMIGGFKEGRTVEELCRKCSYKDRFTPKESRC